MLLCTAIVGELTVAQGMRGPPPPPPPGQNRPPPENGMRPPPPGDGNAQSDQQLFPPRPLQMQGQQSLPQVPPPPPFQHQTEAPIPVVVTDSPSPMPVTVPTLPASAMSAAQPPSPEIVHATVDPDATAGVRDVSAPTRNPAAPDKTGTQNANAAVSNMAPIERIVEMDPSWAWGIAAALPIALLLLSITLRKTARLENETEQLAWRVINACCRT